MVPVTPGGLVLRQPTFPMHGHTAVCAGPHTHNAHHACTGICTCMHTYNPNTHAPAYAHAVPAHTVSHIHVYTMHTLIHNAHHARTRVHARMHTHAMQIRMRPPTHMHVLFGTCASMHRRALGRLWCALFPEAGLVGFEAVAGATAGRSVLFTCSPGAAPACPPGSWIWREHRILTGSYKGEIDGKFASRENVP